ncbi:MAG: hypothetical protein WAV28_18175, partial [Sedimentisphaerales bacterium]
MFRVVDARIDARPGNSRLGLPASSFDTSFDNDKQASFALAHQLLLFPNQHGQFRRNLECITVQVDCNFRSIGESGPLFPAEPLARRGWSER